VLDIVNGLFDLDSLIGHKLSHFADEPVPEVGGFHPLMVLVVVVFEHFRQHDAQRVHVECPVGFRLEPVSEVAIVVFQRVVLVLFVSLPFYVDA
jgi:hypothetical protein